MSENKKETPQDGGKKKYNRPKETAFVQQKLASYRPNYTIQNVFPWALGLGIVLLGIGIGSYFGIEASLEVKINYTNCQTVNGSAAAPMLASNSSANGTQCVYNFNLTTEYSGDVKFYYGLDKFYQNFRLYLSSRNDLQLVGHIDDTSGCNPLDIDEETGFPIVPCGFIANSMFNDTFQLFYHMTVNGTRIQHPVRFTKRNVISDRERDRKFKNPPFAKNETLCDAEALVNTTKPPWWPKPICELGSAETGHGFQNVDFMVWMKPAALPDFRKLYRYLDREVDPYQDGLPQGFYTLIIDYNYPVTSFGGAKYFIIARESWMGARKFFLSIAYMITGVFTILAFTGLRLCVLFKETYLKK